MRALAIAFLVASVLAPLGAGCTTHMPPDDSPEHLRIKWQKDYPAAKELAERTRKPILLITAAGDITGFC